MSNIGRSDGLRTIFSVFLGLMLTVFIGVGVYTFHPPPESFDSQIENLNLREQTVRNSQSQEELSAADRDELQDIDRRRSELLKAAEEARMPWGRSTSIILIVFATLTMAVSLVRADQLPVISNGLLLGGVFTMIYGVGWIAVTDTSVSRFLVITVALVITLGLGYVRFVRRGTTSPTPPVSEASGTEDGAGLADIERRVRDLEERMNEAARALGQQGR